MSAEVGECAQHAMYIIHNYICTYKVYIGTYICCAYICRYIYVPVAATSLEVLRCHIALDMSASLAYPLR